MTHSINYIGNEMAEESMRNIKENTGQVWGRYAVMLSRDCHRHKFVAYSCHSASWAVLETGLCSAALLLYCFNGPPMQWSTGRCALTQQYSQGLPACMCATDQNEICTICEPTSIELYSQTLNKDLWGTGGIFTFPVFSGAGMLSWCSEIM